MSECSTPKHGEICWRELATTDLAGAQRFYAGLFGWTTAQGGPAPVEYKQIHAGDEAVGGMMQIDEKWGADPPPPHWKTYITVSDIEDMARRIPEAGGGVCVPPFEVSGIGKIAIVNDPAGAMFAIFEYPKTTG